MHLPMTLMWLVSALVALTICHDLPIQHVMLSPNSQSLDTVSKELYAEFVRFAAFSSAAYQMICPTPLGAVLVQSFLNLLTNTKGYVARDDDKKQIIVAFRGSQELEDYLTDGNILLVPFESQGVTVNSSNNVATHGGFLMAYNAVAPIVLETLETQVSAYWDYTVISTGHSLGGAIASIASLSIKSTFPGVEVRLFTFGQPRTGNGDYADLVQEVVGSANLYRAVHTFDGVATMIPEALGYRHHTTEYWQFEEPPNPETVRKCEGQEDPTCSASIVSSGINVAHPVYFGEVMSMDATICL
ncbi:alpha/beta-hydrolase [Stereum hirsutum FP-91666 SS1]|uniref:alpha/beta-hydrolase n=1 Tax=Stereum hirsutum (strain FP-91666) TaxID=721885 RepID=UPI000444949F|nr:alpha/beta-hydrolase [Stereum hirsutum FP-91666 SS1]EIM83071.1 alpha/beta-hydrolase [Stereum hirsutum FP-91666 SS1]